MNHRWLWLLLLAGTCCCGGPAASEGELLVLTYNVAGLPEGLSSSHPKEYIPQISPKLNGYELVLVQEDFWYHQQLAAEVELPYRSEPKNPSPTIEDLGDGLNRFANHPFTGHLRQPWQQCHGTTGSGSDCLTSKGFAWARHELPGTSEALVVINLHLDAGSDEGDQQARRAQVEQLLGHIAGMSSDTALLVAGDTNLKPERSDRPLDAQSYQALVEQAGLTDCCRALSCPEETIDRVFVRSSPRLALQPLDWYRPSEFVTATGEDLSDHLPVAVRLAWSGP